jgi:hypothetical protein
MNDESINEGVMSIHVLTEVADGIGYTKKEIIVNGKTLKEAYEFYKKVKEENLK